MPNTIQRRVRAAFKQQGGFCFYCNLPMWIGDPGEFINTYRLSIHEAAPYQCTAEHLLSKCDGGSNAAMNIAAAHLVCNQRRHRMKPAPSSEAMAKIVTKQLAAGCWHRKSVVDKVAIAATAKQRSTYSHVSTRARSEWRGTNDSGVQPAGIASER